MRDAALILHFIGLAMGIGTSFAFMFIGFAASKMSAEEAKKFQINAFAISKMGHTGLTILVITGLYLMTPYWEILPSSPFLIAKLILVLMLGALVGIIGATARKAANADYDGQMKKIATLGKLSMLSGLLIITLAVLNFE